MFTSEIPKPFFCQPLQIHKIHTTVLFEQLMFELCGYQVDETGKMKQKKIYFLLFVTFNKLLQEKFYYFRAWLILYSRVEVLCCFHKRKSTKA